MTAVLPLSVLVLLAINVATEPLVYIDITLSRDCHSYSNEITDLTIQSSSFPTPYASNEYCVYRVVPTANISFTFTYANVPSNDKLTCGQDYIAVDGQRLCTDGTDATIEGTFYVRANETFEFVSNGDGINGLYTLLYFEEPYECDSYNGGYIDWSTSQVEQSCDHYCVDTFGPSNRVCSCRVGYELDADGYSCIPNQCVSPTSPQFGYHTNAVSCSNPVTDDVACDPQPTCDSISHLGVTYSFSGTPSNDDHICMAPGNELTFGGCTGGPEDCTSPSMSNAYTEIIETSQHFSGEWFDVTARCTSPTPEKTSETAISNNPVSYRSTTIHRDDFYKPIAMVVFESGGGHCLALLTNYGVILWDVNDPTHMSPFVRLAAYPSNSLTIVDEVVQGRQLPMSTNEMSENNIMSFEQQGRVFLLVTPNPYYYYGFHDTTTNIYSKGITIVDVTNVHTTGLVDAVSWRSYYDQIGIGGHGGHFTAGVAVFTNDQGTFIVAVVGWGIQVLEFDADTMRPVGGAPVGTLQFDDPGGYEIQHSAAVYKAPDDVWYGSFVSDGMWIVSFADPRAPVLVRYVNSSFSSVAADSTRRSLYNNYGMFVANSAANPDAGVSGKVFLGTIMIEGIQVFDMTDPSAPVAMGASDAFDIKVLTIDYNMGHFFTDLSTGKTLAIACDSHTSMRCTVLDPWQSPNITPLGYIAYNDNTDGLQRPYSATTAVIGGTSYAFVGSVADSSLVSIDLSDPTNPIQADSFFAVYSSYTRLNKVVQFTTVSSGGGTGGASIVAVANAGVSFIDITDPAAIQEVAVISDGDAGFGDLRVVPGIATIAVGSQQLLVVTNYATNGFEVWDTSTLTSISRLSTVESAEFVNAPIRAPMAVATYTKGGEGGEPRVAIAFSLNDVVQVYDLSNPSSPSLVGALSNANSDWAANSVTMQTPQDIIIVEEGGINYVIVVGDGLVVFDGDDDRLATWFNSNDDRTFRLVSSTRQSCNGDAFGSLDVAMFKVTHSDGETRWYAFSVVNKGYDIFDMGDGLANPQCITSARFDDSASGLDDLMGESECRKAATYYVGEIVQQVFVAMSCDNGILIVEVTQPESAAAGIFHRGVEMPTSMLFVGDDKLLVMDVGDSLQQVSPQSTSTVTLFDLATVVDAIMCDVPGTDYSINGCPPRTCTIPSSLTLPELAFSNGPCATAGATLDDGESCQIECEIGYTPTGVQPWCDRGHFRVGGVVCAEDTCSVPFGADDFSGYKLPAAISTPERVSDVEGRAILCKVGYGLQQTFSGFAGARISCNNDNSTLFKFEGCDACTLGYYSRETSATPCLPCAQGFYNALTRASDSCVECATDTINYGQPYTTIGSGAMRCDACVDGYYMQLEGTCEKCNDEMMICSQGEGQTVEMVKLQPGYWRKEESSDVPWIFACPYPPACLGGNTTGNESCAEGFTGPVCAVCKTDYYLVEQTGECLSCEDSQQQALAGMLFGAGILCAVYSIKRQGKKLKQKPGVKARNDSQFQASGALVPKLKIIIPFTQMLSNMEWVYGVKDLFSSEELDTVKQLLSYINFDFGGAIPLGCVSTRTALVSLQAATVPPLIYLLVVFVGVELWRLVVGGVSLSTRTLAYSSVVFYWNIVFPTIAVKLFRMMRTCAKHEGGESFMPDDYGTECHSEQYEQTRAYVLTMIAVFPVGVPLTTLVVLFLRRVKVRMYQLGQNQNFHIEYLIKASRKALDRAHPDEAERSELVAKGRSMMLESMRVGGPASGFRPSDDAVLVGFFGAGGFKLRSALTKQTEALQELHQYIDDTCSHIMSSSSTHDGEETHKVTQKGFLIKVMFELFAYYRVWWWEVFETLRKLLVLGLVVIITEDYSRRILFALLAECVCLYMYTRFKPFKDPIDDMLAEACRFMSVAVLLYALGLRHNVVDNESGSDEKRLYTAMLSGMIVAVFGLAVVRAKILDIVAAVLKSERLKRLLNPNEVTIEVPRPLKTPWYVEQAINLNGDSFLDDVVSGTVILSPKSAKGARLEASNDEEVCRMSTASTSFELAVAHSSSSLLPASDGGASAGNVEVWGFPEPLSVFMPWVVKAAERSHFYPATMHNLRLLMQREKFTKNMSAGLHTRLRAELKTQMLIIGQPVTEQVVRHKHVKIVGSEALQVEKGLMRRPALRETVHEKDESKVRIAQDNRGAVETPAWDWSVEANEKVWIHVLELIAIAINDSFHNELDALLRRDDVLGDNFDGFSPAPPKSYGRMRAKMNSAEDHLHRARPRPNCNVDIVRCLIQVPKVDDMRKTLYAIKERFGGFVKFKNAYDMSEEVVSNEYFHLRLILGSVLYQPTMNEFLKSQKAATLQEKDRFLTYGDLSRSVHVQTLWARFSVREAHLDGEPNARRRINVRRALEYLRSDAIKTKRVSMICEAQFVTRFVGEVRGQMHESYKLYRAPDRDKLFLDYNKKRPMAPRSLVEVAAQGEFDMVEGMIGESSTDDIEDAVAVAREREYDEVVAEIEKVQGSSAVEKIPLDAGWLRYLKRTDPAKAGQLEAMASMNEKLVVAAGSESGTIMRPIVSLTESVSLDIEDSAVSNVNAVSKSGGQGKDVTGSSFVQPASKGNKKKKGGAKKMATAAAQAGAKVLFGRKTNAASSQTDLSIGENAPSTPVEMVEMSTLPPNDDKVQGGSTTKQDDLRQEGDGNGRSQNGAVAENKGDTAHRKKAIVAKYRKVRAAMDALPPKEARSLEQDKEHTVLKKKALKLQAMMKNDEENNQPPTQAQYPQSNDVAGQQGDVVAVVAKEPTVAAGAVSNRPHAEGETISDGQDKRTADRSEEQRRKTLKAKYNQVREAMNALPPKGSRSEADDAKYSQLKKKGLKLQRMIKEEDSS